MFLLSSTALVVYCDRHVDGPLWWLLYKEVSEAFTSLLYHKRKRADLFTSSPMSLIVHTSIKLRQEIHSDWQVLFHGVLIIDDARVKYGLPRRGLVIDGQGSSGQWEGLGQGSCRPPSRWFKYWPAKIVSLSLITYMYRKPMIGTL